MHGSTDSNYIEMNLHINILLQHIARKVDSEISCGCYDMS